MRRNRKRKECLFGLSILGGMKEINKRTWCGALFRCSLPSYVSGRSDTKMKFGEADKRVYKGSDSKGISSQNMKYCQNERTAVRKRKNPSKR